MYMHMCMYMCMYMNMYRYIYVYIHMYIYICLIMLNYIIIYIRISAYVNVIYIYMYLQYEYTYIYIFMRKQIHSTCIYDNGQHVGTLRGYVCCVGRLKGSMYVVNARLVVRNAAKTYQIRGWTQKCCQQLANRREWGCYLGTHTIGGVGTRNTRPYIYICTMGIQWEHMGQITIPNRFIVGI